MKSDSVYIAHILDSIRKLRQFVEGMDRSHFSTDEKTQSAVIMQLALIGELAKKISDNTKSTINLPWKDIAGFRDRAIHDYFEIDLDVVWDTIVSDIDILASALQDGKGWKQ